LPLSVVPDGYIRGELYLPEEAIFPGGAIADQSIGSESPGHSAWLQKPMWFDVLATMACSCALPGWEALCEPPPDANELIRNDARKHGRGHDL